ncbi:hypothetical protein OC835_005003, partial [Tilletia horrida]
DIAAAAAASAVADADVLAAFAAEDEYLNLNGDSANEYSSSLPLSPTAHASTSAAQGSTPAVAPDDSIDLRLRAPDAARTTTSSSGSGSGSSTGARARIDIKPLGGKALPHAESSAARSSPLHPSSSSAPPTDRRAADVPWYVAEAQAPPPPPAPLALAGPGPGSGSAPGASSLPSSSSSSSSSANQRSAAASNGKARIATSLYSNAQDPRAHGADAVSAMDEDIDQLGGAGDHAGPSAEAGLSSTGPRKRQRKSSSPAAARKGGQGSENGESSAAAAAGPSTRKRTNARHSTAATRRSERASTSASTRRAANGKNRPRRRSGGGGGGGDDNDDDEDNDDDIDSDDEDSVSEADAAPPHQELADRMYAGMPEEQRESEQVRLRQQLEERLAEGNQGSRHIRVTRQYFLPTPPSSTLMLHPSPCAACLKTPRTPPLCIVTVGRVKCALCTSKGESCSLGSIRSSAKRKRAAAEVRLEKRRREEVRARWEGVREELVAEALGKGDEPFARRIREKIDGVLAATLRSGGSAGGSGGGSR